MDGSTAGPNLRDRRKTQTRIDIINSAIELFAEVGFDEVSVEAICQRCGISRATFFNYFPQKELILTEVAETRLEEIRAFFEKQSNSAGKLAFHDITDFLVNYAAANEKMGPRLRYIMTQIFGRPACRSAHMAIRAEFLKVLTQLIQKMSREGELRGARQSPAVIAETIFSLYIATSFEWLLMPDPEPGWLARTTRTRLELLTHGIIPPFSNTGGGR